MSVTITIKIDEPTGAAVSAGVDTAPAAIAGPAGQAVGEAPPPALFGGAGGAGEEVAASDEGPPPLELEQLGLGAGEARGDRGSMPPEDVVEASESDDLDTAKPMPIEELERAAKPSSRKKN